jgi:uncharacterized protein YbjT (DUF2867 family)
MTNMADKKVIAVVGATGAQGGGLVEAILADPDGGFAARALTRDADSEKAKELAALGAEVVEADVDDEASIRRAFEGAYGAFCVTFYWNHFSPEKELAQAETLARAAKEAGIRHAVWSTLEDTRRFVPLESDSMPTLMGKYKVPHFDAKGEANHFFTDYGVPTTFLLTSFYFDNFIHFGLGPKRGDDGVLAITLPMGDARLPSIAAVDIGKCAYGILKAGPRYIGETVGIAGGHPTGQELADGLSRIVGETVRYNAVDPAVYRSFVFPGADDLGNMFQFKRDFNDYYCGARNIDLSRSLNPELLSYDAWLDLHGKEIPVGE